MWRKLSRLSSSAKHDLGYFFIEKQEDLEDLIDNINNEYSWSEHHHGIEYENVKMPPPEWIIKKIRQTDEKICDEKRYIEFLQGLLS